MKTIQKFLLAGAAATVLLLAGCADGPYYSGPYDPYPYSAYYGPYYDGGGVVVLNRNFHHGYYGHTFARAGGFHGGGFHGHGGGGFHRR